MHQPELHQFTDVVLHPLLERGVDPVQLPYEGNLDDQLLEHLRGKLPGKFKKLSKPVPTSRSEPPSLHVEEAIFGGYLFGAYGHFLAESIHRLWPLFEDERLRTLPIYFQTFSQNQGPVTELRSYMIDIFNYLGVDTGLIHIIRREPVGFSKLWVPQQVKWLKSTCGSPGYFQRFRKFSEGFDESGNDKLYVSRSRYLYSGSYMGETMVESVLAKAGIKIVFPELHKVADLVRMYKRAEAVALSEGSAIHVPEISGGLKSRVFLVGRRDLAYSERQFADAFSCFAGGHDIIAPKRILPTLKIGVSGNENKTRVPVLFDIAELLERLSAFYGVALEMQSPKEIEEGLLVDFARYLFDSRSANEENPEGLGAQFVRMRNDVRELGLFPLTTG